MYDEEILAEYRRQLEKQDEWALKILVDHYGLSGHDKASYIDALVEHYRKQLEWNPLEDK
jgi:hypothetical protein